MPLTIYRDGRTFEYTSGDRNRFKGRARTDHSSGRRNCAATSAAFEWPDDDRAPMIDGW